MYFEITKICNEDWRYKLQDNQELKLKTIHATEVSADLTSPNDLA